MIKIFENYHLDELTGVGITCGNNVCISNDVILSNPHNIIIGSNVRIDAHSILIAGPDTKIIIGNNVHIAAGCFLFGSDGNIIFEDFSGISSRVTIYTASDDYVDGYMTNPTVDERFKKIHRGDVILKKNTIVGSSSVILPGVTLEFATSVGAQSLVKKSSNPFDILVGSPAKFIKKRKNVYLQ